MREGKATATMRVPSTYVTRMEGRYGMCMVAGTRASILYSTKVMPTIPEDVVGRGGVVWEFEVESPRVGIENEVFEILG